MIRQTYILNGINREALNAQLVQAFSDLYGGFADQTTPEGIIVAVNLADAATPADIDQLNSLMANYDPSVQTPEQQADQERQQRLDSLRAGRGEALDPVDYSGEAATIQSLAGKIAWLEQEVLDLRGGRV